MWRRCYASLLTILIFGLAATPAQAQLDPNDIQSLDQLSRALQLVGKDYADSYAQPITDAFGGGMNAGLFKTADVGDGFLPGLPINVYLGVSATGTLMASSDKRFTPPGPETVTTTVTQGGQQIKRTLEIAVEGTNSVPAAFGSTSTPGGKLVVRDEGTGSVVAEANLPPGLVDTPVAPLLIPELQVGSLLGTDAQIRYLPDTRFKSYGTVGLFGVAVRHSLSQYIPLSPLSIAVQGSWQNFSLGVKPPEGVAADVDDIFNASGWAVNLQASKSLPVAPLTFYGGVQYEKFNVTYDYLFEPTGTGSFSGNEPIGIELDQTAANNVRGIVGFRLTAAFLQFNADYALARNDVFTFGMGVRL